MNRQNYFCLAENCVEVYKNIVKSLWKLEIVHTNLPAKQIQWQQTV